MALSDCVGSEFGAGSLGELVLENARPGRWPYACSPASASDLRLDSSLGLWVPPRQLYEFGGNVEALPGSPIPLNAYYNAIVTPPAIVVSNPSACFGMQLIVECEFTFVVQFTSAHTWLKVSGWVGPATGAPPSPDALPLMKTVYNEWTATGTNQDMVSLVASSRVGLAPGASVTLTAQLWVYAQGTPGDSVSSPTHVQYAALIPVRGWLLTDGSSPVTDLAPGAPSSSLYVPQVTHGVSQAVAQNPGQVDYFYQGTDNQLYLLWYGADAPLTGPSAFGGTLAARPSACSEASGAAHVFYKGSDGLIHHSDVAGNGSWSALAALTALGTVGSAPQAVCHGNGDIHLAWQGSPGDASVWFAGYTPAAGWPGSPVAIGGPIATGMIPSPVASSPGTTDVLYAGTDGNLWHTVSNDYGVTWSGALALGIGPVSQPRAIGHQNGNIDVFYATSGPSVWHVRYTAASGWDTSPTNLGGSVALGGVPWPVVSADGTTDVFYQGSDNNLWHLSSADYGASFSAPTSLGIGPVTQPYAVGQASGNIDVFWRNAADNHVHTARYSLGAGWLGPIDLGGSAA